MSSHLADIPQLCQLPLVGIGTDLIKAMDTLITLVISATNPQNQYIEFIYSNTDFGRCLDQLTCLASYGWQLLSIKCLYGQGPSFSLPVEAFDDQPISVVLSQLQQDWETLLQV